MNLNNFFPSIRKQALRPDPFKDLQVEIARVFDQFNDFRPVLSDLDATDNGGYLRAPNIDITETDTALEITAEIPGVNEEDVDVQLNGDLLTITGKREEEINDEGKNYRIVERSSGSFKRTIRLPFDPDTEKVDAELNAGVLTLAIEKPVEVIDKVKKIAIKKGNDKALGGEKKQTAKATPTKASSKDKEEEVATS